MMSDSNAVTAIWVMSDTVTLTDLSVTCVMFVSVTDWWKLVMSEWYCKRWGEQCNVSCFGNSPCDVLIRHAKTFFLVADDVHQPPNKKLWAYVTP